MSNSVITKLYTTVRYGHIRRRGLFALDTREEVEPGDVCLLNTSRGEELGTVLARPAAREGDGKPGCGSGACGSCAQVQGRIVRQAREDETRRHREDQRAGTREEVLFARDSARERRLPLKVVDAEYLLGRQKLIVHYTTEQRADITGLTQDLAKRFDTRIELAQVGARDEARLVGDMASCGRELCCRTFLHDLKPVSMRMAKQQKKTLDPTKISGQCGKLKCCLRYEDDVYVELQKTMPKKGGWVELDRGVGRILSVDFLLQKVVVDFRGDRELVHVSEILRTGLKPPNPGEPGGARVPRKVTPLVVPVRPSSSERGAHTSGVQPGAAGPGADVQEPGPESPESALTSSEPELPKAPLRLEAPDSELATYSRPESGDALEADSTAEPSGTTERRRRRRRGRRRGSDSAPRGDAAQEGQSSERAGPPPSESKDRVDSPNVGDEEGGSRPPARRRRRRRRGGGPQPEGEGVSE